MFDEVADNADDRVLVITGAGDGFCSGADLSDARTLAAARSRASRWCRCRRIRRLRAAPARAAEADDRGGERRRRRRRLQPRAVGATSCVASDAAAVHARSSCKRGSRVDFGGSWLLPRLVGLHKAKELAFLAEIIDADAAERIGIVNRVVPADELRDAAARDGGPARRAAADGSSRSPSGCSTSRRACRWPRRSTPRCSPRPC